jgi:hypothetical protein
MGERFQWSGRISVIEQKRRRSGEPIEGLWDVTLQTPDGKRRLSFNSSVPKDWDRPRGERIPHPDFEILQKAQAEGLEVSITGTVTTKGEPGSERRFYNGRKATLLATLDREPASGDRAPTAEEPPGGAVTDEEARWAVGLAADQLDITSGNRRDLENVRRLSRDLLDAAHDVAGQQEAGEVVDLDDERKRRSGS